MKEFIAEQDRALLAEHGLDNFAALWALKLDAVDEPNIGRGGWSSVYRLELGNRAFYLKRQSNHLTKSFAHPFGEPTFAREFRNIDRYERLGIPALKAAFFASRRVMGEQQAILLSHALDGWEDLHHYLAKWSELSHAHKTALIKATARLAATLHQKKQMHGCFYPKHVFLTPDPQGYQACLIDLEKTRPVIFKARDTLKDLETLVRRANVWSSDERLLFLAQYLERSAESSEVRALEQQLMKRLKAKKERS